MHAGVWKLCKSLWVEFAISVGHVCSKRKMLVCYKVEYKGLQKVVEGCAEVTREGSCNAGKYNKITVCMLSLDSINQEKTGREFRAKRKGKTYDQWENQLGPVVVERVLKFKLHL